jgi:hypothetical protein
MIGDWLLNLPDRMDHDTRLLPYLLNGLADPNPEIAASALKTIEDLGIQYDPSPFHIPFNLYLCPHLPFYFSRPLTL